MALILDHINGVGDDNRLANLRIVCPNCAATFDTHCGRHNRRDPSLLLPAVWLTLPVPPGVGLGRLHARWTAPVRRSLSRISRR